jgi:Ca2+-binding RTX toxin-like protein
MAQTTSTATSGFDNVYIDTLIGGPFKWDIRTGPETYAFAPSLVWTDAEKNMFRAVFQAYSAVCGLTFSEVDYLAGANFVEFKQGSMPGIHGRHSVPWGDDSPSLYGEYDSADPGWSSEPGSQGYKTVVHEIGHGLNLGHPHDGGWTADGIIFPEAGPWDAGEYGMNQGIWTAMSYNQGWAGHRAPSNMNVGYPITPMALDVAALQVMYGENTAWHTGDDRYQLPSSNGPGTGWTCIWDAGGADTISNAGSSRDCTINLMDAPLVGPNAGGYVSWNSAIYGGYTIAHGAVIENAIGGSGNDVITGNTADNHLQGGGGNDVLAGDLGRDTIDGGDGADVVCFSFIRSFYAIQYVDGKYTVLAEGVAHLVTGVETFRFSDASFSLARLIDYAPTGGVSISGTLTQGQTLRAVNTLADMNGLGSITYQWLRAGEAITGANGAIYRLTQADVGESISLKASYIDGFHAAENVSSVATGAVANINDAPSGKISIGGDATQGRVLSAVSSLSDPDGIGEIHYQWLRGGSVVSGADRDSYALTQADVGKAITLNASWTDGYGTHESVTSGATSAVVNINDAPVGSVTISGTPVQGQILTAAHSLTDADGLGVIRYQWRADGVNISPWSGGTGASFTLGAAQLGAVISVVASYIDGDGMREKVVSAATPEVAARETVMRTNVHGGSAYHEWVTGTSGNDIINGLGGADTLAGNAGNDTITAGTGKDLVDGGDGNDLIMQEFVGYDTLVGGDGVDTVDYSTYVATGARPWFELSAGWVEKYRNGEMVGKDMLSGIEAFTGTRYDDAIRGSERAELLSGGAGNDAISGSDGNDTLNGGDGNDWLVGDGGDDMLNGGAGDDFLYPRVGSDVVNGGAGNDTLGDAGGRNVYVLEGNFGRDTLQAIKHRSSPEDVAVVQFTGMATGSLFFQRSGDDLKITVAGKTDSLTIVEWYDQARDAAGWFHLHVDSFQVGNAVLAGSVVDDLVTVIGAPPVSMASLLA